MKLPLLARGIAPASTASGKEPKSFKRPGLMETQPSCHLRHRWMQYFTAKGLIKRAAKDTTHSKAQFATCPMEPCWPAEPMLFWSERGRRCSGLGKAIHRLKSNYPRQPCLHRLPQFGLSEQASHRLRDKTSNFCIDNHRPAKAPAQTCSGSGNQNYR